MIGWLLLGLVERAGLGALELPLAMVAAALVGPLLLSIIGLSAGQWRLLGSGAGRGAGRLAVASGRGSAALGGLLMRSWQAARHARQEPSLDNAGSRGMEGQPRVRSVVTPLPQRREPQITRPDMGPSASPPVEGDGAAPESDNGGRLVRLVLPRAKANLPSAAVRTGGTAGDRFPAAPEPALPSLGLLTNAPPGRTEAVDEEALARNARMLETVLEDYGVRGQIVQVRPGPVVTLYELEPAPGIKASRVIGLADDIARSMSAISVRVAVVPGRTVIGIELPNLQGGDRLSARAAGVAGLREAWRAAGAGARQGHLGRAGHRRPGAHAASVDRRHDRLRQIGRHQHDDPVDPVPDAARPRANSS